MKLSKERFLCIFIALIIVVSMPLSIAGCQKDSGKNASDEEEKYTVKYDPAGGTLVSGKLKQTVKEGKDASEIKDLLRGNTCGFKSTSCADQLAIAISENI